MLVIKIDTYKANEATKNYEFNLALSIKYIKKMLEISTNKGENASNKILG